MSDFQDAFEAGTHQELRQFEIGGVQHIQVPPGATIQSFEGLLKAPLRLKASPMFHDIKGFADYADEFKSEGTRIYVDEAHLRFFTIFDHHSPDQPTWAEHSASMTLQLSPEWQRFIAINGREMTPIQFAELIEDNQEYISAEGMSAADLLTMAQSFKADFSGNQFDVESTLHNGLRQLHVRNSAVLNGKRQDNIFVSFPEQLNLNLRVFKYQTKYAIKVWLRYRATQEKVTFLIKIPDPDGIHEQAFDAIIADVKEATKLKVLKGAFKGPNHK